MALKVTFLQYLRTQVERETPIGDIARDYFSLPKPRSKPQDKEAWILHLCRNHACPEAIAAFNQAWRQYQRLKVPGHRRVGCYE